jgi:very-short-patch-repair endonuclease
MSSWEEFLANQIFEAKLPEPVREYKFHKTRRWRFDFAWTDHKFAVECHGAVWGRGGHTSGAGFTKDREKMNTALLDGWRVLEITTGQVGDGQGISWIKTYFDKFVEKKDV